MTRARRGEATTPQVSLGVAPHQYLWIIYHGKYTKVMYISFLSTLGVDRVHILDYEGPCVSLEIP
jgi:hypothetical protein